MPSPWVLLILSVIAGAAWLRLWLGPGIAAAGRVLDAPEGLE